MLKGRVLVVEDHEGWHRSLARRIDRAGFAMRGAYTCEQACKLIASEPFDLAIIDVHLPDGRGFELVPLVKQHNRESRVLVASGLPCVKAERLAMDAGADRFAVSTAENIEHFLHGDAPQSAAHVRAPTLDEVETDYVNSVLLDVRGNRSAAAEVLGIRRQSLQRMLRKTAPPRE